MSTTLTIEIPEPCHEDWTQMTPNDKGRHCDSCQKTVHDFTKVSKETLVKTIQNTPDLCGRFRQDQLNTPLRIERKQHTSYLTWMASGLFAFFALTPQHSQAQGRPSYVQTPPLFKKDSISVKRSISVLDSMVIKGQIIDESGYPLPGVNIVVKNTVQGTQTDFDGYFTLRVKKDAILSFSYVGYELQEHKPSAEMNITLMEDSTLLTGDVVVIAGGIRPNFTCSTVVDANALKTNRKTARKARRAAIRTGDQPRTKVGHLLYKATQIFRKNTSH